MRTESGQGKNDAFLCPCPRCAAHNALNAARCWRCEEKLPPPSADALIAAYTALALARDPRSAAAVRVPDGWRLRTRAADGARPTDPAAQSAPQATTDDAAGAPSAGTSTVPGDPQAAPFLRTIAMGDDDEDEAEVPSGIPPRAPRHDPIEDEAAALARRTAVSERFGAFAERAEAASRRRHVFGLVAAVLGTVLILAGYPIYRSAERSLGSVDLRRTPPPPGWPQTPVVAPARTPSTAPLMTHAEPVAPVGLPGVPPPTARDAGAALRPTPVQAGTRAEGVTGSAPMHGLDGSPVHRSVRERNRAGSPATSQGLQASDSAAMTGSAKGRRPPHVARVDHALRRRAAQPWVTPPATSREIAALASGR